MAIASDEILEQMLQPITGEAACGEPLRHDPVFMSIRLEREEDDPTLPMGQWERPLKRADWGQIESRCVEVLRNRSKDLQIVGWLLEAWLRQHELEGLLRGLRLMRDLLDRHWDTVHPQIDEDGDFDARIAAIEWLNVYLDRALRIHITLARVPDRRPPQVTLADWDAMTASELADPKAAAKPKSNDGGGEALLDRSAVRALAQAEAAETELQKVRARACLVVLDSLVELLRERMASDAPSLAGARRTLAHLERVLAQLAPDVPEAPRPAPVPVTKEPDVTMDPVPADAAEPPAPSAEAPTVASPVTGGWRNREEAYRTLEALADYLNRTEPHSPTPYLIRRAVNWGRMPLPELMAEIVREEGDLNRLSNILGMQNRE